MATRCLSSWSWHLDRNFLLGFVSIGREGSVTLRSVGGSLGFLRIIDETSRETPSTQALSHNRNRHGSLSSELTALRSRELAYRSPRWTQSTVWMRHCWDAGQQASLRSPSQGSDTSFPAEAFSREQTQVRAALALNEKHTESFSCFTSSLSSLPGKGQAPWVLPAEFRQKGLGFKSSSVPGPWSQGREWGSRAGCLRTPVLAPPGFLSRLKLLLCSPSTAFCFLGSSQEQHPRALGLCSCQMPWGWGEREGSDPRML